MGYRQITSLTTLSPFSFLGIDKEKKVASIVLANYRLGRDDDERIGISLLESLQKLKDI